MRALVTGARGFAASWLAKALLEEGAEVTSIDRDGASPTGLELQGIAGDVNDVVGDLRDYDSVLDLLRSDRIDSVFHLAAQPIVGDANASPLPTFETNIGGTWVLLEACREARRREGRRRLLGQGVRPPRSAALHRGRRAAADLPL